MKTKNLVKTLTVALAILLPVTLISLLTADRAAAQPGLPSTSGILGALQTLQQQLDELRPRKFYLTVDRFDGAQAPAACAPGFHMASMWEILDPTGLRYDTTLGFTQADSGSGPPADDDFAADYGWIRTGARASGGPSPLVAENCHAYTSNSGEALGTGVRLQVPWGVSDVSSVVAPWERFRFGCQNPERVWCVQD
jgi:hypothetical protein